MYAGTKPPSSHHRSNRVVQRPRRKAIVPKPSPPPYRFPSTYDPQFLLDQCRWIRDELDPQIARDGPDALQSDEVLNLDELLRRLQSTNMSLDDLRFSRLHLAVLSISGLATRWPKKFIEKADALKVLWEARFGPLKELGTPLYEPGGRLHGLCAAEDSSTDMIIIKWLRTEGVKLNPLLARKAGDLGFKPGDWWISPVFAFKDGIIDSADGDGHITYDAHSALAILMVDNEESDGPSPNAFTYQAKAKDPGRYRLTAATRDSRQPVRILRSHSLTSLWAPKAGIRYDGLHRVVGWSIAPDPISKKLNYRIRFERLVNERSMNDVLRRPFSDEVEDYKEFKRLRYLARIAQGLVVDHGRFVY